MAKAQLTQQSELGGSRSESLSRLNRCGTEAPGRHRISHRRREMPATTTTRHQPPQQWSDPAHLVGIKRRKSGLLPVNNPCSDQAGDL
eukprot:767965-Hanusia_phi.AAC.6